MDGEVATANPMAPNLTLIFFATGGSSPFLDRIVKPSFCLLKSGFLDDLASLSRSSSSSSSSSSVLRRFSFGRISLIDELVGTMLACGRILGRDKTSEKSSSSSYFCSGPGDNDGVRVMVLIDGVGDG